MSAAESEWEFGVAVQREDVRAPRRDEFVEPDKRVSAHAYKSGHVELRTARDGEYLDTDKPIHARDYR